MRNIVVGYDGSRSSEAALQQTIAIADPSNARLRLVHAIEPVGPEDQPEVDETTDILSALDQTEQRRQSQEEIAASQQEAELAHPAAICDQYEVSCSTTISYGMAAHVLVKQALGADLLAIGRHGTVARGFIGQTARKLIFRPRVPTLLCCDQVVPVERLLLAYERTAEGGRALKLAADLSTDLNASVDVIVADESRRDADDDLEYARAMLAPHRVQATFMRHRGGMAEALQSTVPDMQSSLVVISNGHASIWPWAKSPTIKAATGFPGTLPLVVP